LKENWNKEYLNTDAIAGDPVKTIEMLGATVLHGAELLWYPHISNEQKSTFRNLKKPKSEYCI
jgi:hypothetical protein